MLTTSYLLHVYLAQYGKYFPRFSYFAFISAKYEKLGKYWPYCTGNGYFLHEFSKKTVTISNTKRVLFI